MIVVNTMERRFVTLAGLKSSESSSAAAAAPPGILESILRVDCSMTSSGIRSAVNTPNPNTKSNGATQVGFPATAFITARGW